MKPCSKSAAETATNHLKGEVLGDNELEGQDRVKYLDELTNKILTHLHGLPVWASKEVLEAAIKAVTTNSVYYPITSS